ncbi:hypothetical protein GE061_017271 [Apolygus lucorum]|uniref:Uncharacterized protein n=1 Tax=Apolygus lucorum TaxID=248454 RepID=A0A8S9XDA0_APOLU|nr:hypothetical protein GE061_017271 [Apolygus lucorum]
MTSHGIDTPVDMTSHGIDTPIDTSSHGIDTPVDMTSHDIDTPIDTSSHDVDTPIDTSICVPDETFIDPVDIKPTPHETTTPAPVEEVPETERKDILEEYEWETRVKVEMPTSPSTSAHVGTPPDEAHALEGTSRRTSTRLNDSVGTDHLRDADHHFDRSSETQMTCAHDRQKDLCAREAQDRHDNARDRNDNARDRHDNAHDRHDNAHDRHDITRNRHDQPEHRYDTSHHETDSEEEEFKDAENDPSRKRPKGDEPETPARYTLRKRESNMMLTGEEAIIGEDHIKKEESSESDLMVEEEMIIEEELFEEMMITENIKKEVNHSSSSIVTDVAECWVVLRNLTEDEIFRWSSRNDEDLPSGDLECGVERSSELPEQRKQKYRGRNELDVAGDSLVDSLW